MDYTEKHIWITGASSGIGRAVAIELSRYRPMLILSGRNKSALEEVSDICIQSGATTKVIAFDLGDEQNVMNAASWVIKEIGRLDALYHFGGISQRSLVVETPLEVDKKIFDINYFGTIALTKQILPGMVKNGGGHIAVTTSIVGKFGFPLRSSYSASKQALHGFFESLRAENVHNNIRVSMIIPGRIKTNISVNAITKDGDVHGKMDEGQDTGREASKSARIICNKLKKEKKEILVGGKEIMMVHIRRFLPSLFYYLASRVKAK